MPAPGASRDARRPIVPQFESVKPLEEALRKIPNRFLLTAVVSRRWEQLTTGAPPLVPVEPGEHKLSIVLREINEEKITVDTENRRIELHGEPIRETHDEPLFNEAFAADTRSFKELLGDDKPRR